jgi:hypothetical protein
MTIFPTDTPRFIQSLVQIGYQSLCIASGLPRPLPPTRWDEDVDDEIDILDDPAYLLACRDYDRQLIAAARKYFSPRTDKNCFAVCGLDISWGKKVAALKTWGGQQTLSDIAHDRLNLMDPWTGKKLRKKSLKTDHLADEQEQPEDEKADAARAELIAKNTWREMPATLYESATMGVSGLMPVHSRVNAIDMGFSPNGQKIVLHPWLEFLVIVGVQFSTITILPATDRDYGRFAVYHAGHWYTWFRRERIAPYYYAWDCDDHRELLPHQFARWIDPEFRPDPFDDLQIPRHLLDNPEMLWNEIERLKRIGNCADRELVI